MKINYISDLHLEFGELKGLPGGDVLVIAGDLCEAKYLSNSRVIDFVEKECSKYNIVFYVMGNHEHYHSRFDKTQARFEEAFVGSNISLLEKNVVEYEGVVFFGATLWTDMNNADPMTMMTVGHGMNDFRVIKNKVTYLDGKEIYNRFTPKAAYTDHIIAKQALSSALKQHSAKPFFVITHHAPSFCSVDSRYKTTEYSRQMNGAYASSLENIMLDNPNIKFWVHGHTHHAMDYTMGSTRVMCNPRGYVAYEKSEMDINRFVEM